MVVCRFLAKSNPPECLREHTEEVIKRVEELRASGLIKLDCEDWEILREAAFYHDLGKATDCFQKVLRGGGRGNCCPHNYLSVALVPHRPKDIKELKGRGLLAALVAFHHWRSKSPKYCEKEYRELGKNLKALQEEMGRSLCILPSKKYENSLKKLQRLHEREGPFDFQDEGERRFIILLGLLMRADHSASAHVSPAEHPPIDKAQKTLIYLKRKGVQDPWQVKEMEEEDHTLVAPTGSGKTEYALLWAAERKLLYTLPMRTSTNAMYNRLRDVFGEGKVGLLHSDALSHLLTESSETDDSFAIYDAARNLAHNVIVSTADQVFTFTLQYPGFQKMAATLSYSSVVVDEIQSYSPKTLAVIVKGIERIRQLGGRVLVITATFPSFLQEHLNLKIKRKVPNLKKHNVRLISEDLLRDGVGVVKRLRDEGKRVLVVFNTVRRAQEFYENIGREGILLHSRFMRRDRNEKEKAVIEGKNDLLVATQVVEVSLDIDYDVLLTDVAPLDVLIQRMGRVFRRYKGEGDFTPPDPNVLVFVPDSMDGVSGKGKVYERSILEKVPDFLKDGTPSEEDKMDLVWEFYSEDNLKGTDYLTDYHNTINVLAYISVNSRAEAQQVFREVGSVDVLPEEALNMSVGEGKVQRMLGLRPETPLREVLEDAVGKGRGEKVLIGQLLRDFMVPIPAYWLKDVPKTLGSLLTAVPTFLKNVPVVPLKYDREMGAQGLYEETVEDRML